MKKGPLEAYRSPWFDLNGYLACTVYMLDGSRKTVLQHREIMEKRLGRKLDRGEHVHHKDEDKRNNKASNLEVLPASEHGKRHSKDRPPEMISLVCAFCGNPFERLARQERHNRKTKPGGPFCGRSCSGKQSRQSQIDRGMKNLRSKPLSQ